MTSDEPSRSKPQRESTSRRSRRWRRSGCRRENECDETLDGSEAPPYWLAWHFRRSSRSRRRLRFSLGLRSKIPVRANRTESARGFLQSRSMGRFSWSARAKNRERSLRLGDGNRLPSTLARVQDGNQSLERRRRCRETLTILRIILGAQKPQSLRPRRPRGLQESLSSNALRFPSSASSSRSGSRRSFL